MRTEDVKKIARMAFQMARATEALLNELHPDDPGGEPMKALDEAEEIIIRALEEHEWTPVSQGLPEKSGLYFCTVKKADGGREAFQLSYGDVIAPGADRSNVLPNGYAFGDDWEDGIDNTEEVLAWRAYPTPWEGEA